MKHAKELVDAIKNITKVNQPVFAATVKTVDKNNNTCEVEFNGMEIGEVRLQAIFKDNQKAHVLYPKNDSWVLVQRFGDTGDFFITMYTEVEEMLVKIGDTVLTVKDSFHFEMPGGLEFEIKDGFLIKKGTETLKKVFDDLFDAIQQLTVNTNVGPSSVPINVAAFVAIKVRVDNFLK